MADRKLRSTVILTGDSGDPPTVLLEGDTPTAEQAKLIDNPKAWDDYDPETAEGSNVTAAPPVVVDDGSEGTSPPADAKPAKKTAAKKAAKKSTAKKK